jgi:O-methyltransferase
MTTREFLDTVARRALSTRATIQASYDIARAVLAAGTPGDFVECGVYAGSNAAAMARAMMDHEAARVLADYTNIYGLPRATQVVIFPIAIQHRRLHLFDSFEGIPQAGPNDLEYVAAGHKAGLSACSLDQVKANMREWGIPDELLVYHPGWFADTCEAAVFEPERFPITGIKQIALLRLDGDLYESTKVCMEHLYPLVSIGGWVICDDYHLSGARKAVNEVVRPGPAYWIKEWERG